MEESIIELHHNLIKDQEINKDNYVLSQETAAKLENFIVIISKYMVPSTACVGLFFTIISILIFSSTLFKDACTLYKYILCNSIFDALFLSLIALKPFFEHMMTENIHELYGFIYLLSVLLTCSNLTKVCFSLDRLTRMTGSDVRYYFKRSPFTIIICIAIISFILNSPLIYAHYMFELKSFKLTYFELVLNEYVELDTWTYILGIFATLVSLFLDTGIFLLLLYINSQLKKAANKNVKTLSQLLENDKSKSEYVIKILDIDQDLNEDLNMIPVNIPMKSFKNSNASNEESKDDGFGFPSTLNIEIERKRLLKLISAVNSLYFLGHALFIFSNLLQKFIYLIYGPNKLIIHFNYFAYWDVFGVFANICLYCSFTFYFFVYLYFNKRFKYAVLLSLKPCMKCLFLSKSTSTSKSETCKL